MERTMVDGKKPGDSPGKEPWGLRWRSSVGFVTFVVMFGILTDQLVYSLIIPVIPYQLKALGYDGIGAKVSWLLVAFSGTLVLATPPTAHYSEVYRNRKIPLLIGLASLIGSQVIFMEAPTYLLMIIARILQGVSATVIWTVGLALLCDSVPGQSIGRQFGIVSMGLTVGTLVGPPVSGALYQRWGFRAPFIFGIIITGIDLVARLLLVERHEAMRWGVDPMEIGPSDQEKDTEVASGATVLEKAENPPVPELQTAVGEGGNGSLVGGGEIEEARTRNQMEKQPQELNQPRAISLPHIVLIRVLKSPRATVCLAASLIWGLVWAAQETTVVLHLNRVWGLGPHQAGIAFIAAIVPTIFSSILCGWLGDRYGSAPVGCATLLLSLPWCGLIAIDGSLAMFLVFFALEALFLSGLVPMLMLELSSVGRVVEGIGYAHLYGALSLTYGVGTTVGPIVAGQMYDRIEKGWLAISLVAVGLTFVMLVLVFFMLGEPPLGIRLFRKKKRTPEQQTLGEQTP